MKIQQGQTGIKLQSRDTASSDRQAPAGKQIKGNVVAIDGDRITLMSDEGIKQTMTNVSGKQFQLNQQANFVVVSFEEGILYVKPDTGSGANEVSTYSPVGAEAQSTKARVDLLQMLNMPVTEDNDQKLKQMLAEIKVLGNEISAQPDKAETLISKALSNNDTMKQMIIMMAQEQTSDGSNSSQNNTSSKLSDVIQQNDNQNNGLVDLLKSTGDSIVKEALSELKMNGVTKESVISFVAKSELLETSDIQKMLDGQGAALSDKTRAVLNMMHDNAKNNIEMKATLLQKIADVYDVKTQSETDKQDAGAGEKTSVVAATRLLLSQISSETQGLFLKNNMPMTLKNLLTTHLLLDQNQTIGDSFVKISNIVKGLDQNTQNVILNLFNSESPEDVLEKLVEVIKKSDLDESVKQLVTEEITFIKEASQVTKQFGDQVMVMHIPVPIESEPKNVKLYFKTRQKSEEDDTFTMLIALNTNYMDEVRCIIEKKSDQINLNFKLVDEAICDAFEAEKKILTDALDTLDIKKYSVTFSVYRSLLEGILIEDPSPAQAFDIKV